MEVGQCTGRDVGSEMERLLHLVLPLLSFGQPDFSCFFPAIPVLSSSMRHFLPVPVQILLLAGRMRKYLKAVVSFLRSIHRSHGYILFLRSTGSVAHIHALILVKLAI